MRKTQKVKGKLFKKLEHPGRIPKYTLKTKINYKNNVF